MAFVYRNRRGQFTRKDGSTYRASPSNEIPVREFIHYAWDSAAQRMSSRARELQELHADATVGYEDGEVENDDEY